jgi:hypothetical protein
VGSLSALIVWSRCNLRGGTLSFCEKYYNSDFVLFAGGEELEDTYRGLHAGDDMSGVLPNFIFSEIMPKRDFNSSQRHASVIHPTSLASTTHITHKFNSEHHHSIYFHIHQAVNCIHNQCIIQEQMLLVALKKCRKYVIWKRGFVE